MLEEGNRITGGTSGPPKTSKPKIVPHGVRTGRIPAYAIKDRFEVMGSKIIDQHVYEIPEPLVQYIENLEAKNEELDTYINVLKGDLASIALNTQSISKRIKRRLDEE